MITKERKEIPIPEIARPRIPHEILFVVGGWTEDNTRHFIEAYDTRRDRWISVSCIQIYLYCALLINACKKNLFFFLFISTISLVSFICLFRLGYEYVYPLCLFFSN
jgi:hypothetical protein